MPKYLGENSFTIIAQREDLRNFLQAASDSREDLSHGVRLPDPTVLGGDQVLMQLAGDYEDIDDDEIRDTAVV